MFGRRRQVNKAREKSQLINLYLIGGMPVVLAKLHQPGARIAAQIFILGMADMQRQVEGLSITEFTEIYEFVLDAHGLLPERPVPEFIDAIARAAEGDDRIGQLVFDGAQSLRAYVAKRDHEAPMDLARAVSYGTSNAEVFSRLL